MYFNFPRDLHIAKTIHEDLVASEFDYKGMSYERTHGQADFDFYIPGGRLECKFDVLSGFTNRAAIEDRLWEREWDYLWNTFTYHRIYSRAEYYKLYKTPERKYTQMGESGFGYLIPLKVMTSSGQYSNHFIDSQKAAQESMETFQ